MRQKKRAKEMRKRSDEMQETVRIMRKGLAVHKKERQAREAATKK